MITGKNILLFILVIVFIFSSNFADARDISTITDWYIEDFKTNIQVNKDSSILIVEEITADCGNLPDKHGIFRVLPTKIKTDLGIFNTPIELLSITDFAGNYYKFQTINKSNTITWKIGDANTTVSGKNYYKITYLVKNTIRFENENFDELYWNLLGNFWDIDVDNFSATINFPAEVAKDNTQVYHYTGYLNSKSSSQADYSWQDNNTLYFKSLAPFLPGQGLTVSVAFPKDIFLPYQATFWEKYAEYFWNLVFLLPLITFVSAFRLWAKHGKDPKIARSIAPEFGIPDNITPIQMAMVISSGKWKDKFLSPAIVDLAVRKFIIIKEIENKILFITTKDIELIKNVEIYDKQRLTQTEITLLSKLFIGENSVKLSTLKNKFYENIQVIKNLALKDLFDKNLLVKRSSTLSVTFLTVAFLLGFISFFIASFSGKLFFSLMLSAFFVAIFGVIMPRRTQAGSDLLYKIKGFELYMKTAEKYRQQFFEKENIFDKFLPYAMVLGIAELWAKKMELIYGQDYFKTYHPIWFVGIHGNNFNLNSFSSQLNSITTAISSNTSSHSGSGGSGGAGGGGGGGGGGGW